MTRPRKWELDALDPSDPTGVKRRTVWIDQGTIDFLTRGNLTARFYRIQCAKDVLATPDIVVKGWNREGFDDGHCYIGRPQDRPKDGIETPPQPEKCFLVFVLASGKVEEWRWEKLRLTSEEDFRNQFGNNWSCAWPPSGAK
jgi:hypothetical protein